MNNIEAIRKLNDRELELGIAGTSASWHTKYASSGVIYVGGLQPVLTEGDLLSIFEQYGVIVHVNLVRDEKMKTPRGFAFLDYEDPRSAILAVDNLNGTQVLERTLRVDHVEQYTHRVGDDSVLDVRPLGRAETAAIPRESYPSDESRRAERGMDGGHDAESKREAMIMKRIQEVRRQRAIEERTKKYESENALKRRRVENPRTSQNSQSGRHGDKSTRDAEVLEYDPKGETVSLDNREKWRRLQEKMKRREERAAIREERRRRRASRQNGR